jgi:hypothetical protein
MSEETKQNCNKSNNCYTIIALCKSFLTLGLLIGNWIGQCQKLKKCNKVYKYKSYSLDSQTGSTCNWTAKKEYSKECKQDSLKK